MPVKGKKFCEVCNKDIVAKHFAEHKKTKTHEQKAKQRGSTPAVSELETSGRPARPARSRRASLHRSETIGQPVASDTSLRAPATHAVKSMARYTAPRRDYQLVINQLYNQYPQYRIFQDNLAHNRSRNDPTAKRYRIDRLSEGVVLDDMKDFIIQLYPDFKNKMKIGFTCIFKKPGRAEPYRSSESTRSTKSDRRMKRLSVISIWIP